MFDVSLVELAVIAVVALLVLGPQRLPRAARTAGLYLRKARQSWYGVKAEIERELAAEDIKRSLKTTGEAAQQAVAAVSGGIDPGLASDLRLVKPEAASATSTVGPQADASSSAAATSRPDSP